MRILIEDDWKERWGIKKEMNWDWDFEKRSIKKMKINK